MQEKKLFETLYSIDVNSNTETKGKFKYLSWTYAWAELQKICPTATYKVIKFDGLPYKQNDNKECIVFTELTINGIAHEMWLPVMDNYNKAMKNPDMMSINKTIMRCLVKNIAMFGLGLYIYAGEDLPENTEEVKEKAPAKSINKPQQQKQTDDDIITKEQKEELEILIEKAGGDKITICNHFKVEALTQLKLSQYQAVKVKCEKTISNTNAN